MDVTGNQLKAARALIGMDQKALSERARVNVNTIRNMEAQGASPIRSRTDTLSAIIAALKAAGVEFFPENGSGAGVRLRRSAGTPPSTEPAA